MSKSFKAPVLVAYPYMSRSVTAQLKKHESSIRFLLDSGAFTAWKAGKQIRVEDYIAFVRNLPIEPWRYFALDVVGDAAGTMKNYEKMLQAGLTPIPVFTRGEKLEMLDELYKTSEVVAIGGLVGTRGNKGFVKGIMQYVGNRKVHWLGFTNLDFIRLFKPYMCDSSSWKMGALYGRVSLYCLDGNVRSFGKGSKEIKRLSKDPMLVQTIRNYGVDIDHLADNEAWRTGKSLIFQLGCASQLKQSYDSLNKVGTNLFLASGSSGDIETIINSKERLGL